MEGRHPTAAFRAVLAAMCVVLAASAPSASADPGGSSGVAESDAPQVRVVRRGAETIAEASPSEALDDSPSVEATAGSGDVLTPEPRLPTAEELALRDEPYKELLRRFRTPREPGSLGSALKGRLYGASELAVDGPHLAVLPDCLERHTNFGTPDLVRLIEDAAAETHRRQGGPRLMVGNLSFRGGGNIPWSRSHNSGLDADLAFFVQRGGEPVETPKLMAFGRQLTDKDEEGYTFDVARNWELVRHLVSHPQVEVQWIFVSRPLRRALLRHARSLGEPEALVQKAGRVLYQPMDAPPHDDHFHVRIFCPARDRVEGCEQTGPLWPWVSTWTLPTVTRSAALAQGLADPKREVRMAVLSKLEDLPGPYAAPAVAGAWLHDPCEDVRQRALELLVRWGERSFGLGFALANYLRAPGSAISQDDPAFTALPSPWSAHPDDLALPMAIPLEPRDGRAIRNAYRLIALLGTSDAAPLVADALRSRRTIEVAPTSTMPEVRMAANAARGVMDLRLVEPLLEALQHDDEGVREDAREALGRILNHEEPGHLDAHRTDAQRAEVVGRWSGWWQAHRTTDRDELLRAGFEEAGVKLADVHAWSAVEPLVALVGRKDVLGYNADRLLREITGQWMPLNAPSAERESRWTSWLAGHRDEVHDRAAQEGEEE